MNRTAFRKAFFCCSALVLFFAGSRELAAQQAAKSDTSGTRVVRTPENLPPDAVRFQSTDSLIYRANEGRKARLFGSAKVQHTAGELRAGSIRLDLNKNTVQASSSSPTDTLSYPILKRQADEIKSTEILFNYKTEKGKFVDALIPLPQGDLIGSQVKNVNESEVFIKDGIFSTCPSTHLYYYIKAKRMKVVDQDEIFFSDARLYILDIPYPLIFPFGYFPTDIEQKKSGLLTPTYVFQDQTSRGIGLQNVGWFQYFNDFLTGQFSMDVFTSGTVFTNGIVTYRKTGQYNGRINLGYSVERGLESTDPDFFRTTNRRIAVSHNQTFSPFSSLTADIDLRTSEFFTRNSFNIDERVNTVSNSRLSYNYRHPRNVYSLALNSQVAQNFTDGSTRLSGPSATFTLQNLAPFQKNNQQNQTGRRPFYENINIRYNNRFQSDFNFTPGLNDSTGIGFFEALFSPSKFREATNQLEHYRYGFQQDAGISISNILPSGVLNVSANANIREWWYPTSIRKELNTETNTLETRLERGFVSGREYNVGLGFNTTIYGVSNAKIGAFEGFRQTIRPTISFNYRPDFSDPKFGFFREVQRDTLGNTTRFSIFENALLGGPTAGEQLNMSFGISSLLETKLVKRDSTGEVTTRTLKLIDNLSANSNYNFAADSLRLGRMNTALTSTAVRGLNFRMNASFSFYETDSLGREINTFLIENGGKLAQLQSLNLSASTTIRGGRNGPAVVAPRYERQYDPFIQSAFSPIDPFFGEQPVINRNDPWSVSLDFNYNWRFRFNQSPAKAATLNASNISFMLTPKWTFSTRMGYDFIQKEVTPSQFNLTRHIECFTMSFQVNPFGDFQYYFFSLRVNSQHIQSIFQKLPLLNNLERTSSPTGRGLPRF